MSVADIPDDLRVVHVDDDPDHRATVAELLAARGIGHVISVGDADTGIAAAVESRAALVILDLDMPGRTGLDALPDLRTAAPGAAIVVLSNLSRQRFLGDVLQRGAVGFVEKSVPSRRLVDEILLAALLIESARSHPLSLAPEPTAPGEGRRFTRELLADVDRDVVADVELVVSELITNVVTHTDSAPRIAIRIESRRIRVEAHDDNHTLPTLRSAPSHQPGGYGLNMVARVSSRWGVERTETGKFVWAELDHRGDVLDLGS